MHSWTMLSHYNKHQVYWMYHMKGNFGTAKIWRNWRPTKNLPNFHHPNFYTSIESYVNIEQIDWKIFLTHVPNKLQLRYHQSPLDSHGLWIMWISCSQSKSRSAKRSSDIDWYSSTVASNSVWLRIYALNYWIYTKLVSCHFMLTIKLLGIVAIRT